MKISVLLLIGFWAGLGLVSACQKKHSCRFPVYDSFFTFRLADEYGVNLIANWGARYNSDSTHLTKMNGDIANHLEIRGTSIAFYIPENDIEALDSSVTRQFLLALPDVHGHPYHDFDTITFKYRFNMENHDESEVPCFSNLQLWYNDSLYHDGEYIDFITFIKND